MTAPAESRGPVAAAYDHCEAVTRAAASNFYWGFRLLPHDRRRALSAVYAFCRAADDIADDPADRSDPARLLARWRAELDGVFGGRPRHPVGVALADAVERFGIPRVHFDAVIDGVEMDLSRTRYETWENDLDRYCYGVAAAVGLIAIEIFGYRNPSARQYAVNLGLAFQLTNILRDVAEDARRGRIYLPRADLARFGCAEADILAERCTDAFREAMAFECARAGEYYGRARFSLAEEDRQSMAPAEAMRLIYEQLLRRVLFRRCDVFGPKVRLTRPEKAALAVAAWARPHLSFLYRFA
ncbi:MAG TPA: presqualene diphosphate synthase HpnD [Candidatus Binatia bacterium]|jgi:phytoene synthase|nr:presqualene diphosphate synthase HpnD [Candidatus Binatia bacterium]